jgi:hypothetical protein
MTLKTSDLSYLPEKVGEDGLGRALDVRVRVREVLSVGQRAGR